MDYPITIVYLPLKWCGFAYALFSSILLKQQYYPENAPALPQYRLFGQFHAPQTDEMKEEILHQLTSSNSVIRVVFATVAMGMGVDIHAFARWFILAPLTLFSNITRRLVELGVMENQARQFSITTTGTYQKTNQVCKICYGHIVELLDLALELNYWNVWTKKTPNPYHHFTAAVAYACLSVYVINANNKT